MYKIQESGLDQKWASVLDNTKYEPIKDQYRRDVTAAILENTDKEFASNQEAISMMNEAAPANSVGTYGDTGGVAKWDSVLIGMIRRAMPQLIAYDVCGVQPLRMPAQLIFAMKSRLGSQGGEEALFNESISSFSGQGMQYGTSPVDPSIVQGNGSGVTVSALTAGSSTSVVFSGQPHIRKNGVWTAWSATNSPVGISLYTANGDFIGTVSGITNATTYTLAAAAAVAVAGSSTLYAYSTGTAMSTQDGEKLGTQGEASWAEMAFTIEKTTVTAGTRALKTEYSMELVQDMRNVHGLDAEQELSKILTSQFLSEQNREILRSIYKTSKWGAQSGAVNTAGTFDLDLDSNGRWSVEKFKGLMFQIERDANVIAQQTRLGRGNIIICSADVASALAMTGKLDYNPALNNDLLVDESSATFAGILNNRYKVYIDPFSGNNSAANQFYVVGFKSQANPYGAGIFYCPYVPMQMVRAVDPGSFQPKLGFKGRYAVVANPFASGSNTIVQSGLGADNANVFYSKTRVTNLM
jgi:hypothetical protein